MDGARNNNPEWDNSKHRKSNTGYFLSYLDVRVKSSNLPSGVSRCQEFSKEPLEEIALNGGDLEQGLNEADRVKLE